MKGYKTLGFAALVALTSFLASPEMSQWVGEHLPEVGGGLATAIAVLRAITNSPMLNK